MNNLMVGKMTGRCPQIFERLYFGGSYGLMAEMGSLVGIEFDSGSMIKVGWVNFGGHGVLIITGPHRDFKEKLGQMPVRDAAEAIPMLRLV